MHEWSLMRGLLAKILSVSEEHHARRVTAVRVRLGVFCHLSPEHFREHFAVLVAGTVAEGARLDIVVDSDLQSPHAHELVLESVEVEE